jgi:hypothetical protein
MFKQNWLNKWEREKEIKEDLLIYQYELDRSIIESISLSQQLKAVNYRIELLKDKIKELNETLNPT